MSDTTGPCIILSDTTWSYLILFVTIWTYWVLWDRHQPTTVRQVALQNKDTCHRSFMCDRNVDIDDEINDEADDTTTTTTSNDQL